MVAVIAPCRHRTSVCSNPVAGAQLVVEGGGDGQQPGELSLDKDPGVGPGPVE